MLIITVGHVDHGKTSLIRALTGQDPSRLAEEKRRGLTIDLGFVYIDTPNDTLGFIDVPGHERFIHNMLAGISSIDYALVVVAADDGIMPQTLEHLTILYFAGITQVILAITKCDRVDSKRLTAVQTELFNAIQAFNFSLVDCFFTSTEKPESITKLKLHLLNLPPRQHQHSQQFRLAIDRSFTLKGSGTVITGTVSHGFLQTSQLIWLAKSKQWLRIKQLHAMNKPTQHVKAGERAAINLGGEIHYQDLQRGDMLFTQPQILTEHLDVCLHYPPFGQSRLQNWQMVNIFCASQSTTARYSNLGEYEGQIFARLYLSEPCYLWRHDVLILRVQNETIARATVLELNGQRRGCRRESALKALSDIKKLSAIDWIKNKLDCEIVDLQHIAQLYGQPDEQIDQWLKLLGDIQILSRQKTHCYIITPVLFQHYCQRILQSLKDFHHQYPAECGISQSRLLRLFLPQLPAKLLEPFKNHLLETGILKQNGLFLHLATFSIQLSEEEELLYLKIQPLLANCYEGYWVRDIAKCLSIDETIIRALMLKLTRLGKTHPIVKDRFIDVSVMQSIIETLHKHQQEISIIQCKDTWQIGRKVTIQILEYCDHLGITYRTRYGRYLRHE